MTDRTRLDASILSGRPLSSGLISILVLLGAAMACSGNSELGGGNSDAKGGTGTGQGGAGTGQGGAGNGHAGTAQGGAGNGHAGTAQGGAGTAQGGDCSQIQCFRAINCVAVCGGTVLQSGCCSCPTGTFDSIQCSAAGGGSTTGGTSPIGGASANGGATTSGGAASRGGASAGGASANGGAAAVGGATSSGGASAGGTATSAGASSRGGASAGGVTGTGGNCALLECFRNVDCVATCGGPILQSGCCACPTGTFDSVKCSGAGGASSTGGASSAGGAGTAGATSQLECKTAADCKMMGDCCGCHSLAPGQDSGCPMECLSSLTCNGFDPQPTPECRAGRCVLSSSCDDSRITCKRAVPQCAAGKLPTVTADGTCYDGNCIDITECSEVSSCSVCSATASLVATQELTCVYDLGVRGVAHCVSVSACMLASRCACYGELCGGILPCGELSNGISCGAG